MTDILDELDEAAAEGLDIYEQMMDMRFGGMILCSLCGNKRCPHATDHRHECTGSNEPGQPGSSYA